MDFKLTIICLLAVFALFQSYRVESFKNENMALEIENKSCSDAIKFQNQRVNELRADNEMLNSELINKKPLILEKYKYIKDASCEAKLKTLLNAFYEGNHTK